MNKNAIAKKRQLFVNIQQGLKLTFFGSVLQMIKMAGKPDGVENFVQHIFILISIVF